MLPFLGFSDVSQSSEYIVSSMTALKWLPLLIKAQA